MEMNFSHHRRKNAPPSGSSSSLVGSATVYHAVFGVGRHRVRSLSTTKCGSYTQIGLNKAEEKQRTSGRGKVKFV
ncbi:hypothetical protein quinque_009567 [Culex quinquefasciatus]